MNLKIKREMRALVYRGKDDLRVETVPVPRISSGELLVKVAVCGVCPTDIKKIKHGTVAPPRIFGHETAGTIVKMGAAVRGFHVGQRVALHHHVPCLNCHACRHRAFAQCDQYKRTGITAGFEPAGGGFAEYVRVMPFVLPGVVPIPAKNSFEEGALLEPVNTVLKAVKRLRLLRGDVVVVVGQGPIGLMFTALLRIAGIRVLGVDLMPQRLTRSREFGALWAVRPDEVKSCLASHGLMPDAAVITAPSDDAVREYHELVRGGAPILLFAHTTPKHLCDIDLSLVCVQERDLMGSYSADCLLQRKVAKLLFSREFDGRKLVTHHFPLIGACDAIELASKPTPESLKICVCPADGSVVNT